MSGIGTPAIPSSGGSGGSVTQGTTPWVVGGNVASGVADSGNPVKVGGVYNSTAPTFSNGQRGDSQLDINGNQEVNLRTLLAGESQTFNRMQVLPNYSFNAITTGSTTTVKSGAGVFHSIVITGGTAGTITIYDNTAGSGTTIATFSSTNNPGTFTFDVAFSTGLTIVTSAATNVTVSYI